MSDPQPQDQLKDEAHDFDGIQEYDNDLPRWWLWLFAITIVWAIWYIPFYHGADRLGSARLKGEMAELSAQRAKAGGGAALGEEALRQAAADAKRVARGRELYQKHTCASCHGGEGTGGVGPNLRDPYWIYGSQMTQIYDIVANGRDGSGMAGYKNRATPDEIADMAAFIVSLNREGRRTGKPHNPAREKEAPLDY
jgi:cytochrome c oxidase cbb3-type subunit 3